MRQVLEATRACQTNPAQASERQEPTIVAPRQRIADGEELDEYQGRKRKEFEARIRYSREMIREWIKYAVWEASQNQYERCVRLEI